MMLCHHECGSLEPLSHSDLTSDTKSDHKLGDCVADTCSVTCFT